MVGETPTTRAVLKINHIGTVESIVFSHVILNPARFAIVFSSLMKTFVVLYFLTLCWNPMCLCGLKI